jgi:hypothetical protein
MRGRGTRCSRPQPTCTRTSGARQRRWERTSTGASRAGAAEANLFWLEASTSHEHEHEQLPAATAALIGVSGKQRDLDSRTSTRSQAKLIAKLCCQADAAQVLMALFWWSLMLRRKRAHTQLMTWVNGGSTEQHLNEMVRRGVSRVMPRTRTLLVRACQGGSQCSAVQCGQQLERLTANSGEELALKPPLVVV